MPGTELNTAARDQRLVASRRAALASGPERNWKSAPSGLAEMTLPAEKGGLGIGYILQRAGLVDSTSEALRMIKQGAVKVDGERLENPKLIVPVGESHLYQVGKRRFVKVKVVNEN